MADLKQIKVGSTTYNIEPYTDYLPLAGGLMTGNIRMTENSTSIILRSASADWYSGIYANSSGDEVLGIVVANPRTHIMLGTADPTERPACTSLTPAIDIKNGKVGINKRIGTDGAADAGSYELDVNGSSNVSGNSSVSGNLNVTGQIKTWYPLYAYAYNGASTKGVNCAAIVWDKPGSHNSGVGAYNSESNVIYFGPCAADGTWIADYKQIWKFQGTIYEDGTSLVNKYVTLATNQTITGEKTFTDDLTVDGSLYFNNGAEAYGEVYFNDPVEFYNTIWTSDNITTEGSLLVSGDITGEGQISVDGDANIAGDAKINGQIIGRCLLNSTAVTLSNSSSIYIPLNTSQVQIGTAPSYLHRGPTGTYKVVFPSSSCQVVTSSTSNMGSATYKVGSTTTTQSNLSGTAQGGGSSFNASVNIPSKTLTVTLTYGSSYTFSVTYTKSSSVTSITSYGVYASEGIYAYPYSSTSSQGTIGIGVGGSGSPYVYRGQTNIGGESNSSYEVILGAAGKTYTYLSSPTGTWSYASDKRDKTDIELINSSLHFINKLQPVTYVENMRENYINEDGTFNQESHQTGVLKKHRRRAGFLAQDVYELLKKEYGTDNYASVVDYNRYKKEDEGVFDRYSFNGVQLIPFLVKAIQEQQDIIESLEEKINLLEEKIQKEVN